MTAISIFLLNYYCLFANYLENKKILFTPCVHYSLLGFAPGHLIWKGTHFWTIEFFVFIITVLTHKFVFFRSINSERNLKILVQANRPSLLVESCSAGLELPGS